MSIKSTITMKRAQALEKYFSLLQELYGIDIPGNQLLGSELDRLYEELCEKQNRPCFYNYIVEDD